MQFVGYTCEERFYCFGNEVFCDQLGDFPERAPFGVDQGNVVWVRSYGVNTQNSLTFDGPVSYEQAYNLTRGGGRVLDPDQIIETYALNPDGTRDETNMLQKVQFHSSCSQPLVCLNAFGGHTVVGFQNPSQDYQNCLRSLITSSVDITFDATASSDDVVEVVRVSVTTDYDSPPTVQRDEFRGFELSANNPLSLDVNFNLADPWARRNYTTAVNIIGSTIPGGILCQGDDTAVLFAEGLEPREFQESYCTTTFPPNFQNPIP